MSNNPLTRQSSILEARGGVADVTVDVEAEKKYEEIIEMLLAAGYFRARISSLSRFDKIIGGLTWCITSANVDVDIDIFFQENAQIGKKIELGESIEDALIRMKCPEQLQSNQIRGLDTKKIFPVIRWLVQKVIATREETGDLLRIFSESQFSKSYELPEDSHRSSALPQSKNFLSEVSESYKPKRKYRRPPGNKKSNDEESRVESVLLEYGYLQWASRFEESIDDGGKSDALKQKRMLVEQSLSQSGGGAAAATQTKEEKDEEERKKKFAKIDSVMKTMIATSDGQAADSVATNRVGDLVGFDAEIIAEIAGKYGGTGAGGVEGLGLDDKQLKKMYGEELHRRTKLKKEELLKKEMDKYQGLFADREVLHQQVENAQQEYLENEAYNLKKEQEIQQLLALETPENKEILDALRGLVELNEKFKQQEKEFKESCQKQLKEFQEKIKEYNQSSGSDNAEERKRLEEIDAAFKDEKERLEQARALAAKKNREIAMVQRKIDEVPNRSELQQYQRQFIELYEQVSSKLTETRKYYNTFNTLADTREFLKKEVSILNSIDENYKAALTSQKNKESLRESVVKITSGVNENLNKVANKFQLEKKKKEEFTEQLTKFVEKEREFYALTKEFQVQCAKNAKLLEALGTS